MSTEFGQVVFSPNRPSSGEGYRHHRIDATHNAGTFTSCSHRCTLCDGNHSLASCTKFTEMRIEDRITCSKSTKRCFRCLKPNHVAANCRLNVVCGELGCSKSHHSLVHFNEETSINVCGSTASFSPPSYLGLGFVSVRLVGPTGHRDTHVLIDDGLDATLISEDVAKKTGVNGIPSSDVISTPHGSQSVACAKIDCKTQSLGGLASTMIKESSVSSPFKSPDIPYHGGIEYRNISDLILRDDVNGPLIDNKSNAVNDIAIAETIIISDISPHEFVADVSDNVMEEDSSVMFSLKSLDIPYHDGIKYSNQVSSKSLCRPPETMYSGLRRGH